MTNAPVYLDYASTTPLSKTVFDAMLPYLENDFYNPSALYLSAKASRRTIEDCRERCAKVLEVRPSEITFAAGSTEANVIALRGVMERFKVSHCVYSAIEHVSVIETLKDYNSSVAPVDETGIVDTKQLTALINDTTVLVSCMAANNEVGTVQPIADIAKIIDEIKVNRKKNGNSTPIFLHVDASQSFNYLPVFPHKLGIDLLVIGGSKIYGPKQTSLLYCKAGVVLKPVITGGGQEYGLRSGTENTAMIVGLTTAIEEADTLRISESKRQKELQNTLLQGLRTCSDTFVVNGSIKHRLPNNVHVTFIDQDNERLVMELDESGFMVATGSACSASSDEPSHVLTAMGISKKHAQESIRITTGRHTSTRDIEEFISVLAKLLHR